MIGALALLGHVLTIPAANWLILNVGTFCIPNGPCVVPVWPSHLWSLTAIYCPSGSLMIGVGLVLRDVVQRAYGAQWSLIAVAIGTLIAAMLAPPALVMASALSFALSELADFAVYTPLHRRRFLMAVALSSVIGLIVDSILFLAIAFGSLDLLPGILLGKLWMVLLALPLMIYVRRHFDQRDHDREVMTEIRRRSGWPTFGGQR